MSAMALQEIAVDEARYASLKGQIVLITGGASGIGLATTKLLLSQGASVVVGDINELPLPPTPELSFQKTDVTSWADLLALFKKAKQQHGRIDHVFANAGVTTRVNYLEENLDEHGDLLEPSYHVIDINLKGVLNTATLAIHYMKPQRQTGNGSIVLAASSTSFQTMRAADYAFWTRNMANDIACHTSERANGAGYLAISKHGVLGVLRALLPNIKSANLPIRLNAINPAWTDTGIVSAADIEAVGGKSQPPEVVARSVALLMTDESRDGQAIYSADSKLYEIEQAVLQPAARSIVGTDRIDEDNVFKALLEMLAKEAKA